MIDLHNKVLLVSLKHIDENENVRYDTFFGVVNIFNDNTVVVVDKVGGGQIDLPYADSHFEPATDEWYELKNGDWSDEIDFIVQMDVFANDIAYDKYGAKNT
ncbi:hypothetical protein [Marinomonas balearica]|uniref:Uncharacterized protein n=1 Tax=Marinomonas balearica TaxID=491947 RepID=A0A4R6M7T3_9GAMM|nr:hypothetical protein [Marinomonas balearica]TDO96189.1 hypothetical protein DFP79_2761 [Marinomonas balearica]